MPNNKHKDYSRAIKFHNNLLLFINENKYLSDIYYEFERDYFIENHFKYLPSIIINCRSLNELKDEFYELDYHNYEYNCRMLIKDEFYNFLYYLEFGEENYKMRKLNSNIEINLNNSIHSHIEKFLSNEDYFHAVEESYKVVREKLKEITSHEKATDAFNKKNYINIFGHEASNKAEEDFFDGVKYLNMGIQFLRNEKTHSLAEDIERNQAMQYIALANLAYELIDN